MFSLSQQVVDFPRRDRRKAAPAAEIPEALRCLPRGVSVITFVDDGAFVGLTATSVSSLSRDPPSILVSVDRRSSASKAFLQRRWFGISVLAADQDAFAERFSSGATITEAESRNERVWATPAIGAPLLAGAVAAFDCEHDDAIECHGSAIVVGRVRSVPILGGPSALVCWRGGYDRLGWTEQEISRAVGIS